MRKKPDSKTLALLAALGLLLSVGAAAAGKTYRWVDDKGRVHYSDTRVAKAIELNRPGKPAPAAAQAETALNTEQTPGSATGLDPAARKAECERKRAQLNSYQTAQALVETDALGNSREYSAAEKQKLISRTQAQLIELCAP